MQLLNTLNAIKTVLTGGLSNYGYHTVTPLSTPTAPTFSTAATGGSLAASTTYYYRITAVSGSGESLASTEASQATAAGTSTNTITLAWAAVTGAESYKVYGRSTGAELLIASGITALTYTDTGSVTPAGALPTTNSTGAITGSSLTLTGNASCATINTSLTLIGSAFSAGIRNVTANYTIANTTDFTILCNGTFTVTLPTATGNSKRIYVIKNVGTGTITVTAASGTVEVTNLSAGQSRIYQNDGTEWWVIGGYG